MRVKVCALLQRAPAASESCEGLGIEWAYIIVGRLALGRITKFG